MNLSRRRLFALGAAATVAPMLPAVALAAAPVAPLAEIDAALKIWETYRIKPTHVYWPPDFHRHPNCRCVLTPIITAA